MLRHTQRSKARMHTFPDILRDVFCSPPVPCFGTITEGIYLRTRSDGRLFNLARLRAKIKVWETTIRDVLFADDAAIAAHSQQQLRTLLTRFAKTCKLFGLTIILKKTKVMGNMGQDVSVPPEISIDDYELEAVHQFTYMESTITTEQPAPWRGAQQTYWEGRNDACPPHHTRLIESRTIY